MQLYKDRLLGKKIDCLIVPAKVTTKKLCAGLGPCLTSQLLEFALRINRVKNQAYCPSSTQGVQSTQSGDHFFGPTCIPWKTKYECQTGKKLVLSQDEMRALYDYLNSKRSQFGPILREVLNQLAAKKFARQKVFNPNSTQGIQSSQRGDLQFCVKVKQPYCKLIKSNCHENCCQNAKKRCGCKGGECKYTNCF